MVNIFKALLKIYKKILLCDKILRERVSGGGFKFCDRWKIANMNILFNLLNLLNLLNLFNLLPGLFVGEWVQTRKHVLQKIYLLPGLFVGEWVQTRKHVLQKIYFITWIVCWRMSPDKKACSAKNLFYLNATLKNIKKWPN